MQPKNLLLFTVEGTKTLESILMFETTRVCVEQTSANSNGFFPECAKSAKQDGHVAVPYSGNRAMSFLIGYYSYQSEGNILNDVLEHTEM